MENKGDPLALGPFTTTFFIMNLSQAFTANPELGAAWRVWSVAGLLLAASDALVARFPTVVVRGEIGNFSRAASGHSYFSLKDESAQAGLRCVMFRRAAALLDFAPRDGTQVELRGRLSVYEARGELQLVVESMRRVGAGALFEDFVRLRSRLSAEGLFDSGRKRALPAFPRCIGLITSPTGAALHDVVSTLQRRAPHVQVLLIPAQVQGAGAVASLLQALAQSQALPLDAVLLCRGGGSQEDLAAFNAEALVRAVAACIHPVVAGVGHETDLTLVDLAADLRAPTPTAAAEMAVPAGAALQARLDELALRLARAAQRPLELAAQRLDGLALRLREPARTLERQHERLAFMQQRLHALDPRQVLARGYTWLQDAAGQPVMSAQAVAPGQVLQAVWVDGAAQVLVQTVKPTAAQAVAQPVAKDARA